MAQRPSNDCERCAAFKGDRRKRMAQIMETKIRHLRSFANPVPSLAHALQRLITQLRLKDKNSTLLAAAENADCFLGKRNGADAIAAAHLGSFRRKKEKSPFKIDLAPL